MGYRQERHPDVIAQLPNQKSRHFRAGNCKPLPLLCYYYSVVWEQCKGLIEVETENKKNMSIRIW